jgi:hypothetical protein
MKKNALFLMMLFSVCVIHAQKAIQDTYTISKVKRTDLNIPVKNGQPDGRAVCSITSLPSLPDQSYKYTLIVNVVAGKAKSIECSGYHKYAVVKYDLRKHDYVKTGQYETNHITKIDDFSFDVATSLIDALRYGNAQGKPKKRVVKAPTQQESSNSERPEIDFDEGEDEEEVDDCMIDFSGLKEIQKLINKNI